MRDVSAKDHPSSNRIYEWHRHGDILLREGRYGGGGQYGRLLTSRLGAEEVLYLAVAVVESVVLHLDFTGHTGYLLTQTDSRNFTKPHRPQATGRKCLAPSTAASAALEETRIFQKFVARGSSRG